MNTIAALTNLLGPMGLLLVALIALLFGGKKLPQLARGIRDSIREFQRGKNEPPTDSGDSSKKS